ncbi:unnamed protein product [Urochloa humidicola]
MANAEARAATALLLSFSAVIVLLLLARRDAIADLLLDRFNLDGRGLLDLATKRNMVLLCHAILLIILRDAGILGAPASRRAAIAATDNSLVIVAAASVDDEAICSSPPLPRATADVVLRRPRRSAKDAGIDESGRRLIKRRQPRPRPQPAVAAAAAAAQPAVPCVPLPALTEEPEQAAERQQQPLASKEIVLVEKATTKCASDRRVVVADNDEEMDAYAAAEGETPELADDRRIQEFIDKQWSKIRQESLQLQLLVRSGSQQAAIPTC